MHEPGSLRCVGGVPNKVTCAGPAHLQLIDPSPFPPPGAGTTSCEEWTAPCPVRQPKAVLYAEPLLKQKSLKPKTTNGYFCHLAINSCGSVTGHRWLTIRTLKRPSVDRRQSTATRHTPTRGVGSLASGVCTPTVLLAACTLLRAVPLKARKRRTAEPPPRPKASDQHLCSRLITHCLRSTANSRRPTAVHPHGTAAGPQ